MAKWGKGDGDWGTYDGKDYDSQLWKLTPRYTSKDYTDVIWECDNRTGSQDFSEERFVRRGNMR